MHVHGHAAWEQHFAAAWLKHWMGTRLTSENVVAVEAGKQRRQLSAAGCGAQYHAVNMPL